MANRYGYRDNEGWRDARDRYESDRGWHPGERDRYERGYRANPYDRNDRSGYDDLRYDRGYDRERSYGAPRDFGDRMRDVGDRMRRGWDRMTEHVRDWSDRDDRPDQPEYYGRDRGGAYRERYERGFGYGTRPEHRDREHDDYTAREREWLSSNRRGRW